MEGIIKEVMLYRGLHIRDSVQEYCRGVLVTEYYGAINGDARSLDYTSCKSCA